MEAWTDPTVWVACAIVGATITASAVAALARSRPPRDSAAAGWDYEQLVALVKDEPLPAMLVDLGAFRRNVRAVGDVATQAGKTVRVATKSIRVPELIGEVFAAGGPAYRGLMCYSMAEVELLSTPTYDFDDFLLAYPLVQTNEFETAWRLMTERGRKLCLMIDCPEHVRLLDAFWRSKRDEDGDGDGERPRFRVCLDVDMSYRLADGRVHLGAHRSPIHDLSDFKRMVLIARQSPAVELVGIMTYEAQIAGVPDSSPFVSRPMNALLAMFKSVSATDCTLKRSQIAEWLRRENISLEFFNGGGTGSLQSTANDAALTEVTVGSGLLQSNLFDFFQGRITECAFCFGLRVTRLPGPGIATCHSGGFIASGPASADKCPSPLLPAGVVPFADEGFGEVQTPLQIPPGCSLRIGDPVFFRPAKAGEIAERFNEYMLFERRRRPEDEKQRAMQSRSTRNDADSPPLVVRKAKTYRGLGLCAY